MRPHLIALSILVAIISGCHNESDISAFSKQNLTSANVKVWGNCEMCQETIESSLKTPGVFSASWNSETKLLSVTFDSTQISLDKIHKQVAASGYDTEMYKADEESYKNLHECCQYERKP